MLQSMRDNSKGIIAKVIVGLIVVTFALFGVESIISLSGSNKSAVTINGEDISEVDVLRSVEMQKRSLAMRMGANFNPDTIDENLLRQYAIQQIVDKKVLLQWADSQGMSVSDQIAWQQIASMPGFQLDGEFDGSMFDQAIRQFGFSRTTFKDSIKEDRVIAQLQNAIAGSNFMTTAELEFVANLEAEKRSFDYVQIPVEPLKSSIEITDEDKQAYYEGNQQRFKTPEMLVVDYVEMSSDQFAGAIEISEDDTSLKYEQMVESIKEKEQRKLAHILIAADDSDAETKAKAVKQKLDDGADFAELAKAESADTLSAEVGGDLGFSSKGIYEEAFETIAFSLNVGDVSEPIKTVDGYHIIKVLEVKGEDVPAFADAKEQIVSELKQKKARAELVTQAEELANVAFSASDLNEVAEDMGLSVKTTSKFARVGGEGIAAEQAFVRAAFSETVLDDAENSNIIEISEDKVAVLRLKERFEPTVKPLEEVEQEVISQLTADKSKALADDRAKTLVSSLKADTSYDIASVDESLSWTVVDTVDRKSKDVAFQILKAAFAMPKPNVDAGTLEQMSLPNGDAVVVRLRQVEVGKLADFDGEELKSLEQRHIQTEGRGDFDSYAKHLKDSAEVEKI